MDNPINLFKTFKGQARYFAAYDAALGMWPVPHESRFVTTPCLYSSTSSFEISVKDHLDPSW
jgi:hypothetical protein